MNQNFVASGKMSFGPFDCKVTDQGLKPALLLNVRRFN